MIVTRTSLRLSILGGNTDFREYYLNYGGLVLTSTIDKYIYCIVKKRFDDRIIVNYTIREDVEWVDELKHDLVREALRMVNIQKGIEITFLADIPSEGSGLGSSSAVTIGLLNALYAYKNENVSSYRLADDAVRIELDILKKHIGIQDQYAIAMGGLRQFVFKTSGKITGNRIIIPEEVAQALNDSLMLFYTGITRKADSILSSFNVQENKALLDQNKQLAEDGTRAILKNKLDELGRLLDLYWKVKRQLSDEISNPDIDDMYKKAREAGAWGGKIVGAGGGGFLLIACPVEKKDAVRKALKDKKELLFSLNHIGSTIVYRT